MVMGDFKKLNRRTVADKVLRDKTFNIAKNPKYDGYQCRITSMTFKFFNKQTSMKQSKLKLYLVKNSQDNYTNHLLENLRKEKYTHFS